jgi:hypothetical protein
MSPAGARIPEKRCTERANSSGIYGEKVGWGFGLHLP